MEIEFKSVCKSENIFEKSLKWQKGEKYNFIFAAQIDQSKESKIGIQFREINEQKQRPEMEPEVSNFF